MNGSIVLLKLVNGETVTQYWDNEYFDTLIKTNSPINVNGHNVGTIIKISMIKNEHAVLSVYHYINNKYKFVEHDIKEKISFSLDEKCGDSLDAIVEKLENVYDMVYKEIKVYLYNSNSKECIDFGSFDDLDVFFYSGFAKVRKEFKDEYNKDPETYDVYDYIIYALKFEFNDKTFIKIQAVDKVSVNEEDDKPCFRFKSVRYTEDMKVALGKEGAVIR